MAITVTDNVEVAGVTVNGHVATQQSLNVWGYQARVKCSYNQQKVIAWDTAGNSTTSRVNYAHGYRVRLTAMDIPQAQTIEDQYTKGPTN